MHTVIIFVVVGVAADVGLFVASSPVVDCYYFY